MKEGGQSVLGMPPRRFGLQPLQRLAPIGAGDGQVGNGRLEQMSMGGVSRVDSARSYSTSRLYHASERALT
jgi:hypothetical protein